MVLQIAIFYFYFLVQKMASVDRSWSSSDSDETENQPAKFYKRLKDLESEDEEENSSKSLKLLESGEEGGEAEDMEEHQSSEELVSNGIIVLFGKKIFFILLIWLVVNHSLYFFNY